MLYMLLYAHIIVLQQGRNCGKYPSKYTGEDSCTDVRLHMYPFLNTKGDVSHVTGTVLALVSGYTILLRLTCSHCAK